MNTAQTRPLKLSLYTVYLLILIIAMIAKYNGYGANYLPWYMKPGVTTFLSALVGFVAGIFFSRQFASFRGIVFISLLALAGLVMSMANPIIGGFVIFILAMQIGLLLFHGDDHYQRPTEFGSAEWATLGHLLQNKLIGEQGLSLGMFPTKEGPQPLHYEGNRHLLTVAPTRSGKGVSSIIPNLLTYKGSAVVIDPKGENAMITAYRRGKGNKELHIEGLNQNVHVVDPWGISGLPSSCFNPLDWLKQDDPDINENAMILAESIITPRSGSQDQFWDDEAKALLMGLLLFVATEEAEQENRHLGRVRDIISSGEIELNTILNAMMESDNVIVRSAGTRTFSKEERLRSSVLASLQAHTHFLDSPRMRESLSRSDFGFEDLKKEPTTIYLVLPADRLDTFGRWLRLMIQQALTINARNIEETPEKPILFLLDEMASLGRLSMVEKAYSLMAGFGVQLWGIIQDVGQLERIYGKGWQTFIGNSGVVQYFGSRDYQTADYFSKLCGVTTIEKFSISSSIARAISNTSGGQSGSSSSSTTTTQGTTKDLAQRKLAYPDELMVMKGDREIIFVENFNPISGKKVPWFNNEQLKNLGINLKKNLQEEAILPPTYPEEQINPGQTIEEGKEFIKDKGKKLFAFVKDAVEKTTKIG